MTQYESVIICAPNLSGDDLSAIVDEIKRVISDNGGEVKEVRNWGKRKLAYRIQKFNEGTYLQINFIGKGDCVKNLERFYRLKEGIIRFLTVKLTH